MTQTEGEDQGEGEGQFAVDMNLEFYAEDDNNKS